jgi:hypothetical protein
LQYYEDGLPTRYVLKGEEEIIDCHDGTHDARFVSHARTDIPALLAHIEEQAARVRELEADRKRLDWLDEMLTVGQVWEFSERFTSATVELATYNGPGPHKNVRSAIDAARKGERG